MNTRTSASLSKLYAQHLDDLGERYGAVMNQLKLETLIVHSGAPQRANPFDDYEWPLKLCPTFSHWLPLCEAHTYLVLRPGKTPEVHQAGEADFWHSPTPCENEEAHRFFVWKRGHLSELRRRARGPRVAFIGNCDRALGEIDAPSERVNLKALVQGLHGIRAIKTDYERHCIALANQRAARGHQALAARFAEGEVSELELHHLYLATTGQDGRHLPYRNIVALGANAAFLHHDNYGREQFQAGSLLVDAGATFCGYASDITRTTARTRGEGAEEFAALVAAMDDMQQALCAALVPGVSYQALHEQCHQRLAGILIDAHLAYASTDELVERGVTRAFFPHGLGHSLGIQVHDVGCLEKPPRRNNPHLRANVRAKSGHVFTVEPGCYFIRQLLEGLRAEGARINWPLVDRLRAFGGIRIEDNIAVTDHGNRNLTRDNWLLSTVESEL